MIHQRKRHYTFKTNNLLKLEIFITLDRCFITILSCSHFLRTSAREQAWSYHKQFNNLNFLKFKNTHNYNTSCTIDEMKKSRGHPPRVMLLANVTKPDWSLSLRILKGHEVILNKESYRDSIRTKTNPLKTSFFTHSPARFFHPVVVVFFF